ncbi:hypothetical protein VU04_08895 [Desulfobulbus sp. TB]|nr:hypothetical protein [Desulfobulbus sp. TB]
MRLSLWPLYKLGKQVQYGVISTGDDWMFLEIFPEQQLVYQHHRKFYLPDIRRVANILLSMLTSGATVQPPA